MMKALFCHILFLLFMLPMWSQSNIIENYIHISKKEGISHNNISTIHDDCYGAIWIGTFNGLDVYDSKKLTHIDRFSGMPINSLFDTGKEMFVAAEMFLEVYDYEAGRFSRITYNGNELMYAVSIFRYENDVIILSNGNIYKYKDKEVTLIKSSVPFLRLVCDKYGVLWGLNGDKVYKVDKTFEILKTYNLKGADRSPAKGLCIYADSRSIIWIGTIKDGLFKYNRTYDDFHKETIVSEYKVNDLEDIASIAEDEYNRLWIGYNYGLAIYDYNDHLFRNYAFETNHNSLQNVAITSIYRTKSHNMVIGSYFSGLFYIKELNSTKKFYTLTDAKDNIGGVTSNGIVRDRLSRLWVATNCRGVSILDENGKFIKRLDHTNSVISNNIICLEMGLDGNVWAGGLSSGLYKIAPDERITHYMPSSLDTTSLSGSFVQTLCALNEDSLLVATNKGIDIYLHKVGTFSRILTSQGRSDYNFFDCMVCHDKVYLINSMSLFGYDRLTKEIKEYVLADDPTTAFQCGYADKNGHLWLGTRRGELFSFENGEFQLYIKHKAINTIAGIEGDAEGNLWLSSGNNLFRVTPQKEVRQFNLDWGLDGKEFNVRSSYTDKEGCIYFGATEKLLKFDPQRMVERKHIQPVLYISALKLFNVPVESGSSILKNHIDNTDRIVLDNDQNFVSFAVVSIDYNSDQPLSPYKIVYQLENYDNHWYDVNAASNEISFTGLSTGNYVLHIQLKADNGDVLADKKIEIKVLPPLWLSPYMIVLYILLLGIVIYAIRSFIVKQRRAKELVAQSKREQAEMEKLNTLKLDFFTSLSHEFQRPLAIISTLQNDLLPDDSEQDSETNIFKRNVKRLQYLIDQLMDFRNIESQHAKVKMDKYDIVCFLNDIYEAFTPLFRHKEISHEFISDTTSLPILFDSDKLEILIGNLLSNAFKHTRQGGKCYLKIAHKEEVVTVDVFNSGPCLTEEQKTAIFQPYNSIQIADMRSNGGIGLSIANSIVKLLNIHLSVISVENEGNIFRIEMPLHKDDNLELISPRIKVVNQIIDNTIYVEEQAQSSNEDMDERNLFQVLIVEDDADTKKILKKKLQKNFHVLLASDSDEALLVLKSQNVDMVISNTAPQVDGLGLCKTIKDNEKTNRILVLLISSDLSPESKIAAFQAGTDAFMQKPIHIQELLLRMNNMLKNKNALRSYYSNFDQANVTEQNMNNADEVFLKNLTDFVLQHLSDPEMSVNLITKHFNISRTLLYMNVKRITDQTPSNFILNIKMSQAKKMLLTTSMTSSEIADQLGYCNSNHFSRQFKEYYNTTPGKFRKQ